VTCIFLCDAAVAAALHHGFDCKRCCFFGQLFECRDALEMSSKDFNINDDNNLSPAGPHPVARKKSKTFGLSDDPDFLFEGGRPPARPLLMEVQIKNSTMPLVRRSRFFSFWRARQAARLICTGRLPLLVCMLPAARELI
jgi:hypothetical protein